MADEAGWAGGGIGFEEGAQVLGDDGAGGEGGGEGGEMGYGAEGAGGVGTLCWMAVEDLGYANEEDEEDAEDCDELSGRETAWAEGLGYTGWGNVSHGWVHVNGKRLSV